MTVEGLFTLPSHPWATLKRPILNGVKKAKRLKEFIGIKT